MVPVVGPASRLGELEGNERETGPAHEGAVDGLAPAVGFITIIQGRPCEENVTRPPNELVDGISPAGRSPSSNAAIVCPLRFALWRPQP